MAFKTPDQIATAAANAGIAKANLSPDRMFGGSILAGAYIAFAGLLVTSVMGIGMYLVATMIERRTTGWAMRGADGMMQAQG